MQVLVIMAAIMLATGLALSLINFRFLMYPLMPRLNPFAKATHLSLEGNILFISDLHLRANHSFEYTDNMHKILQQRRVSNLIVVGDLFDSPEDAQEILGVDGVAALPRILGAEGLRIALFFVHGSPQHDLDSDRELASHFRLLGECAIITCGRLEVVVCHGHDMSRKGMFGHGCDRFIAALGLERAWKRFAQVPESDWVILGHLHIPGLDLEHRVGNCGGWQTIRLLVKPACTAIFLSPEKASPEIINVAEIGK